MKILADTNILFSALLFPRSKPSLALFHAAMHHELFLCDQNLREFRDVLRRKAPQYLPDAEVFLVELPFELISAPESPEKLIDDPKDQPILNAAILAEVDVIISGDKHFLKLDLDHPKTITPAEYLTEVGVE
jgi:predicted nucleic acid-binding protein